MATPKVKIKLEDNVLKFINQCADAYGHFAADSFNQDLWCECLEIGLESPIEQILYCAIKTVAKINGIEEATDPVQENGEWHVAGLTIMPQAQIGKYRADFRIIHERKFKGRWEHQQVIVECDSQQFHERTEEERRYEKQRDRFFTTEGYKVFHFTGTEIVKNSWSVAAEILEFVVTDRPNREELLGSLENCK